MIIAIDMIIVGKLYALHNESIPTLQLYRVLSLTDILETIAALFSRN